jgi:hypothetical protein
MKKAQTLPRTAGTLALQPPWLANNNEPDRLMRFDATATEWNIDKYKRTINTMTVNRLLEKIEQTTEGRDQTAHARATGQVGKRPANQPLSCNLQV